MCQLSSAAVWRLNCKLSAQLWGHLKKFRICRLSAGLQSVSSLPECQLLREYSAQLLCSAAIPWLNHNVSAQPHTVMDLRVCAPDLATASPSAIAGCAYKLEFCKFPTGSPAHRCAGEVWVCCCRHDFMFVATSEAWLSARLPARLSAMTPAGGLIVIRLQDSSLSNECAAKTPIKARCSDMQKSNASTSGCFRTENCCIWYLLTETSCSQNIINW